MSLATETEARMRVDRALQHIQRAQEELGRAQAELSSVIGVMPLWNLVGKLYDRVHSSWYQVKAKADRVQVLDLDGCSGPAFEKRLAAAKASTSPAVAP